MKETQSSKSKLFFTAMYISGHDMGREGKGRETSICKVFCPKAFISHAQYDSTEGSYRLKASSDYLYEEWNALKKRFLEEPELNRTVNLDGNGMNPVFPLRCVQGRKDMLRIDTGESLSLEEFSGRIRPEKMTKEYLLLSLVIIRRLTAAVSAVHQTCLHLGIAPQSVYIDSKGEALHLLNAQSRFTVHLLDLSTAIRKGEQCVPWRLWESHTEGYSKPGMKSMIPCAIDESFDLFSIAAVLYFLLTGTPPRTDCETFLAVLPNGGFSCDAQRQHLEDVLSAALGLCPGFDRPKHALEEFAAVLDRLIRALADEKHSVI